MHVHLATALPDNAHDARVGDGRFDSQSAGVELLESFAVLLRTMQLYLQRVHLQQLRPFLHVIRAILSLARPACCTCWDATCQHKHACRCSVHHEAADCCTCRGSKGPNVAGNVTHVMPARPRNLQHDLCVSCCTLKGLKAVSASISCRRQCMEQRNSVLACAYALATAQELG